MVGRGRRLIVALEPTGTYGDGVPMQPLSQVPVYPGEPINGPMTTDYPMDESLPPIPAPMYR